ncbi:MAG: FixH family protein [Pseudomonadota bacterium]
MHNPIPTTPWYRHRWPWLLMIGPVLVIVAGAFTGWLAYTRQDAMVVDDYYKKGKAINQDLRRDRVASAMGLSLRAVYDGAVLSGSISQASGPHRAPFWIQLAHATQPAKDQVLNVVPDAQGRFKVLLPGLEKARWQVVVEGAQRDWRLAVSWRWPAQAALVITADPVTTP